MSLQMSLKSAFQPFTKPSHLQMQEGQLQRHDFHDMTSHTA